MGPAARPLCRAQPRARQPPPAGDRAEVVHRPPARRRRRGRSDRRRAGAPERRRWGPPRARSAALTLALGSRRPPVTAPKSCTGHLLGAAGAVEAIAAVLALKSGVVPAIRNLDDPDDEAGVGGGGTGG